MSLLPSLAAALVTLLCVSILNIHSPVLKAIVSSFHLNDSTQKNTTISDDGANTSALPFAAIYPTSSTNGDGRTNETAQSYAPVYPTNATHVADKNDISNEALNIGRQMLALQEKALAEYRSTAANAYNASDIVGVANAHNHTAIPCQGKRIAIIGSSHGRSLAFSFAAALTGSTYATEGEEIQVPLFNFNYSAIPEKATCNSWEEMSSDGENPRDSCDLPKYKPFFDDRRICRYTYDAGIDVGNCGYPGMKRWAVGAGSYFSDPSVPINYPMPYAPEEPHLSQIYFIFKTWTHSPKVDEKAMRHIDSFRPDVLVLDFSMWGCRTPDKLKTGRTDWPEDEARNCTNDFIQTVTQWDRAFASNASPSVIIHYVNSVIQPLEELNANLAAVKQLQQYSRTKIRHVLIDKRDVVDVVDARILGHGFLGAATDIWARTALEVLCPANSSYI